MGGVKTNAELGQGKAVECRELSVIEEPTQSLVALAWSSHSTSMGSSVLRGMEVRCQRPGWRGFVTEAQAAPASALRKRKPGRRRHGESRHLSNLTEPRVKKLDLQNTQGKVPNRTWCT